MADQFSEVTSESWFGRIGNSIKGILFGIILIPVAVFLLYWNESRAVTNEKSLKEGDAAVVSVSADAVSPTNNEKLIHVSGSWKRTILPVPVRDPMFAVSANALRLGRDVTMYQWKEEVKSDTHQEAWRRNGHREDL